MFRVGGGGRREGEGGGRGREKGGGGRREGEGGGRGREEGGGGRREGEGGGRGREERGGGGVGHYRVLTKIEDEHLRYGVVADFSTVPLFNVSH